MGIINVVNLKKRYPLYKNKKAKLKEAFSISRKSYHEDFWALKGLNFVVEKGECVGIIGLNGSGKSTLLKILSEIVQPTDGEIQIFGRVSALLELGSGFNPNYTGIENIYLNTMLQGYTREQTESKLQEIIDFADIGEFLYQPVKLYSTGMFVRLAFAIAVCVEPDILIVDEALSVGDVLFQQKCYARMKQFAECATVLIVSHDMDAITKLCTRCIVMDHGNIVYDGRTKEAVTEYLKIKQGELTVTDAMDQSLPGESLAGSHRGNVHVMRASVADEISGKLDTIIDGYYYEINGVPFSQECKKGDRMLVEMCISSQKTIKHGIVGYQVRDIYGNEIFGETSLTSGYGHQTFQKGHMKIQFSFEWPEIREGAYFITLGVGDGNEVMGQTEQCWLNQTIHLYHLTYGKLIYGFFNQRMASFDIRRN